MTEKIALNRSYFTGKEIEYMTLACKSGQLCGDGAYTQQCQAWLEANSECKKALLTHSCTGALEMSALLLNIQPGDEIIMPSFTYSSTANAFALRGGVPVFVDIRSDTLNIDETLIEAAITPRTRAIVPIHYAGVACEMDTIISIAKKHDIKVIEDAAQGIMAKYKNQFLGSIGDLGTYSFHGTKNIISGEGGALLINDPQFIIQAEIIRDNGTDRAQFSRNLVPRYSWQSLGSSYLPGELIAAFLLAQLESAQEITEKRVTLWQYYQEQLEPLEIAGKLRRPVVSKECEHNAHTYYILLPTKEIRNIVLEQLAEAQIQACSHYVPLHLSPAGMQNGRANGELLNTLTLSERLIRLPLWVDLTTEQQNKVIVQLTRILKQVS